MTMRLATALLASAAMVMPLAAEAQQDQTNVPVQNRARPDFDPLGIRAGAFLIYPSIAVSGEYDDNIFADDEDEEDDFSAVVRPRIEARSQWSRHALNVGAFGDFGFFLDESDSNYEDFGVDATGRLDVRRDSRLNTRVLLERDHEDRGAPDEAGVDDVTDIFRGVVAANYRHSFARFFVQPGVTFTRLDFDDVAAINNDDRDRIRVRGRLRGGLELTPAIDVFAEGDYDVVRYDETPDDAGRDRDNEGFSLRGGAELDFTDLIFGEVSAGFTHREFDDDDLESASGVSAAGEVTWNITPLTSLIGRVNADIQETTVVVDGEPASSNLATGVTLEAHHELLRNVLLNGRLSYTRNDFEGVDRTDDNFRAGAGVRYFLGRNIALDANYQFSTRSSDVDSAEFDRNVVRVGITARL